MGGRACGSSCHFDGHVGGRVCGSSCHLDGDVCRSLCRWWRRPSHPEVELSTSSYTATEAAPDAPAHFAKAATRVLQRVRRADLCNVEPLSLPFRHITHDPEPTVATAVAVVVLQPAVFAACADLDSGASFVGSGTVQSKDRSSSSRCPVLLRFFGRIRRC